MNKWEKYLFDSTVTNQYTDVGGIAGDDDYPTGNILMGYKVKKVPYYNRLQTGFDMTLDVDGSNDWGWDEFEGCRGMESKESYHKSLQSFFLSDELFRRIKSKEEPKKIPKDQRAVDTPPDTDAFGDKEKYDKKPDDKKDKTADTSHISEKIEMRVSNNKIALNIMNTIDEIDKNAFSSWGSKNFVGIRNGIRFEVRGSKFVGRVIIKLNNRNDMYDIEFGNYINFEFIVTDKIERVKGDKLVKILDQYIG